MLARPLGDARSEALLEAVRGGVADPDVQVTVTPERHGGHRIALRYGIAVFIYMPEGVPLSDVVPSVRAAYGGMLAEAAERLEMRLVALRGEAEGGD